MDDYNSYFCDCVKSNSNQKGFGNRRDLILSNFKNLFGKGDIRHYGDPKVSRNVVQRQKIINGERVRRRRKSVLKNKTIKRKSKTSKTIRRKSKPTKKNIKAKKGKTGVKQRKRNSRIKVPKRISGSKRNQNRSKAVKSKKIFRDIFN